MDVIRFGPEWSLGTSTLNPQTHYVFKGGIRARPQAIYSWPEGIRPSVKYGFAYFEGMQITSLHKHTAVAQGEIPWVQLVAMETHVLSRGAMIYSCLELSVVGRSCDRHEQLR